MSSPDKKFKKGELIFREGDAVTSFYLLQSGKVSLFLNRADQKSEIDQPIVGHVIGEQGVFGFPKQVFNAEALTEVKVIELPVDPIKTVFEKSPGPYRAFVKALGDEVRRLRNVIKGYKLEQDNMPCPPRFIPRLCAILVLVSKSIGQKPKLDPTVSVFKRDEERAKNPKFKDEDLIVSFTTLKIYTSRMFLESSQRMQSFCELLSKLGYLSLRFEKNEENDKEELVELRIHDLQTIELFGEFYQHNYFKAGRSEVIHPDKTAVQIAAAFCAIGAPLEADRNGLVKMEYKQLLDELKAKYFIDFKEVHVGLLEKKGLYLKRQPSDEKMYVSFDRFEWTSTFHFWQIIQEINRWNETGSVNLNENLNEVRQPGQEKCPGCGEPIKVAGKFCPECGAKLAA